MSKETPESKVIVRKYEVAYWACPKCGRENKSTPSDILYDNHLICLFCNFETSIFEMRND